MIGRKCFVKAYKARSISGILHIVIFFICKRQSANAHPIVDDAAKNMQDAVKDLTDTLEEAASETGAVTGLVESISKAMNEVCFPCSADVHQLILTFNFSGRF